MVSQKSFFNTITAVFVLAFFSSCDKDLNTIGGEIIGGDHFDLLTYREASVKAFNQPIGVVQSNNLETNPLGVYTHPVFGKTTAHFVTQLEVNSTNFNPVYGANIEVESVELTVPYSSTRLSTTAEGVSTYKLDSIYGNLLSKMKLSVYENGFFIRDLDPASSFTTAQKYYTDQKADFDANIVGTRLNDDLEIAQNDGFFFDPAEKELTTVNEEGVSTTTKNTPRMLLKLNKNFFKNKILSAQGKANMVNNNVFKNYFRGLYFKVDEIPGESNVLALLNFKQGKIVITYKEDLVSNAGVVSRTTRRVELSLTGNTVSLQEFDASPAYQNALATSNPTTGDAQLFLKGGPGSMAVIDLFTPEQLETLRANRWFINEANLTFYIDNATMGTTAPEPNRIYLYDLNNKRPVIDYLSDFTANTVKPKYGKIIHSGLIKKEAAQDGRGVYYKVRITDHVANLIRLDSTNVRLGLVVTEDYRLFSNASRKNPQSGDLIDRVPLGSVLSPLGTVLFGNHPSVPENKRLKLEVFYTRKN